VTGPRSCAVLARDLTGFMVPQKIRALEAGKEVMDKKLGELGEEKELLQEALNNASNRLTVSGGMSSCSAPPSDLGLTDVSRSGSCPAFPSDLGHVQVQVRESHHRRLPGAWGGSDDSAPVQAVISDLCVCGSCRTS
jgi:hypothetical protein